MSRLTLCPYCRCEVRTYGGKHVRRCALATPEERESFRVRRRWDRMRPTSHLPPALRGLTPKQQRVLTMLCEGLDNLVIASRLELHEGTVKKHVHAILHTLGVETRHAAAVLAIRSGFGLDESV